MATRQGPGPITGTSSARRGWSRADWPRINCRKTPGSATHWELKSANVCVLPPAFCRTPVRAPVCLGFAGASATCWQAPSGSSRCIPCCLCFLRKQLLPNLRRCASACLSGQGSRSTLLSYAHATRQCFGWEVAEFFSASRAQEMGNLPGL